MTGPWSAAPRFLMSFWAEYCRGWLLRHQLVPAPMQLASPYLLMLLSPPTLLSLCSSLAPWILEVFGALLISVFSFQLK